MTEKYVTDLQGDDQSLSNEQERLAALHSYHIVNTQPEQVFNNIVSHMAEDFEGEACICFVDKEAVFTKATTFNEIAGTPRRTSLCTLTIQAKSPIKIQIAANTNLDAHSNQMPVGTWYAAAPVLTPNGFAIGTVSVYTNPGFLFTKKSEQLLVRYASRVMHELTTRCKLIHAKNKLTDERKKRKRLVEKAIVKTQKYERSQIGLELHDNISQILTTVRLYNEMALSGMGNLNGLLEMSNKYLYKCIEEIRSLSRYMCAPGIKGITLADLIKDLVDSINRTKKTEVSYIITGLNDNFAEHDHHLVVYRVVQEQLNNIIKHADASYVTIELYNSENGFQLLITDNGKGFDLSNKAEGIGLINMRRRIEKLSGIFTINSSIGKGCQLHVDFPAVV